MEDEGFEASLKALEDKVRKLESGDVPLDEALGLFEQGVDLAKRCHAQLDAAEERVAALTRGERGITERPMADLEE